MYLQLRGTSFTQARRGQRSADSDSSWVVALVEFGQEVSGTSFFSLVEISHYVSLLLPDVDCFLELHLPLRLNKMKMEFTKNTAVRETRYSAVNEADIKQPQVKKEELFYLDDQHVNHAWVSDVLVFIKHLPDFVSPLTGSDVQLKNSHCGKTQKNRSHSVSSPSTL